MYFSYIAASVGDMGGNGDIAPARSRSWAASASAASAMASRMSREDTLMQLRH